MPLYRNSDRVILFMHIPKTGGSTLEEVLKARGAEQALKYHKRLGYSNANPQHMHWDVVKHWIPASFYDFSLAMIRNPYSRLVSEYRWRASISDSEMPPFSLWVQRQFVAYSQNPFLLDNHIRPQVQFVSKKCKIFRLEDGLERPIRIALRRLDMSSRGLEIHHKRKSSHSPVDVGKNLVEKIKMFYNEDFERFEYDPEDVPETLYNIVS